MLNDELQGRFTGSSSHLNQSDKPAISKFENEEEDEKEKDYVFVFDGGR